MLVVVGFDGMVVGIIVEKVEVLLLNVFFYLKEFDCVGLIS